MNHLGNEDAIENFRKRYYNLHPLIFHRSVERAGSLVELFEILETIPSKYPIAWNDNIRSWVKETDITAQKKIKNIREK
jgi:hypothetical protein